jgi:hypothetical protein
MRLILVLAVTLAVGAAAAQADVPTNECAGIQQCLRARGPWVFVPAHGWASYLLDCPRRRGIAAGVESVASSPNIRVSWDAKLGSPASPGRSTSAFVFFRAISGNGKPGFFQPRIGCIPTAQTATTYSLRIPYSAAAPAAADITIPGAPLNMAAANVKLRAGTVGRSSIGCIPSQQLVDSWTARAFRTELPPNPALAQAIQVKQTLTGKKASVAVAVSEALPPGSHAEVQLGVMCAVS